MDGRATEESWQLFMQPNELLRDVPMPGSQKGIKALERAGYPVHYLTARELYQREATIAFLSRYFGFNDAKQLLVTRTESITGKRVKSAQFKENAVTEVLKPQLQERYGDHTLVFLDDHYPNLNMFARHGIALKSPEIWKAIHT